MNISEALKKRGLSIVETMFLDLQNGKKLDLDTIERYIQSLSQEISHQREGMLYLITGNESKEVLLIHTLNVILLSMIMAYRMGIEGLELKEIGLGAFFHDLGKINTPEKFVWKQDGDSDYEKTVLAEHPTFAAQWLSKNAILSEEILMVVKYHHERFDEKGFPEGIAGRDLPRCVTIVAICNYYDYLVTDYPEKKGLESRNAFFKISQQGGKRFHHNVINQFITLMGPMLMDGPLYQRTALVLLDTREVAAVIKTNGFADTLPDIVILTNSQGKKLERPLNVELKKDRSRKIIKLLKA